VSRIDEAQRRLEQRQHSGAEPVAARSQDTVDALAKEPYPVELAEHRPPVRTQVARPTGTAGAALLATAPYPTDPSAVAQSSTRTVPLIELIDGGLKEKVVIDGAMMPVSREQYRRLAATLHHEQSATGVKVIMITSAVPGEGKTLTAANLALTFSESYQRSVLLIDADLRRPSQHTVFSINNSTGLSDGLESPAERAMKVRKISEHLSVLPAGPPTSDPMAGLTSPRMHQLLEQVRGMFDWIIIDTPPVGLLTDAKLLTSFADGTILVVQAGQTPYPIVNKSLAALGQEKLIGVVLNRAERAALGAHHYDYDYDDYYAPRERKKE
jgi:capsular exopolysaccharide synthesis family protein